VQKESSDGGEQPERAAEEPVPDRCSRDENFELLEIEDFAGAVAAVGAYPAGPAPEVPPVVELIVDQRAFDVDLVADADAPWRWADPAAAAARYVGAYFQDRNEDAVA